MLCFLPCGLNSNKKGYYCEPEIRVTASIEHEKKQSSVWQQLGLAKATINTICSEKDKESIESADFGCDSECFRP